jgi:hypothetical protein
VLGRVLGAVRGLRDAARHLLVLACYTALLSAVFVLIADAGVAALPGRPGPLFLILWAYATTVCLALTGVAARLGAAASLLVIAATIILGNTSAGGPVPRPLLNSFFATLTPFFPQGAGLTMVRGVIYFNGHGLGPAAPTLAVWGGMGLLLLAAAGLWHGRAATARPPSGPDQTYPSAARR